MKEWVPGTAIVHKGEPTAVELALLRFAMTDEERKSINEIVRGITSRHTELHLRGDEAVDDFIDTVTATISEQGRATPIVEVWDDPLDNGVECQRERSAPPADADHANA